MNIDIGLSIIEVDPPNNLYCDCGHISKNTYKRNGPDSLEEPIRFFRVYNQKIDMICCEPCLVVAQHLSRKNKV